MKLALTLCIFLFLLLFFLCFRLWTIVRKPQNPNFSQVQGLLGAFGPPLLQTHISPDPSPTRKNKPFNLIPNLKNKKKIKEKITRETEIERPRENQASTATGHWPTDHAAGLSNLHHPNLTQFQVFILSFKI